MDERFDIITYKNKKIYFSNYKGIKPDIYVEQIKKNTRKIIDIANKDGEKLLLLNDVSNTYGSDEVLAAFKASAKDVEPVALKSAVIGLTGLQKILYSAVSAFSSLPLKACSTREDALEWLVKE